ncbi:hypothetical protein [Sphingobacterium sp. LRF_L2]|uniref:hypothetical protein n=1 Tax=Sphingobacterium sp. LRF_L2 TaxID=3369421 RepID=UPI003F6324FF
MVPKFLSTCGHIILIYMQAFFYCCLLIGWQRLPGGEYGMLPFLLLLLGAPVLGLYLLYVIVCYFLSRPIIPTDKMIKIVFIVSAGLVMLAGILNPLDVINFVFIASLLFASIVSGFLHRLLSKGQISKGTP